MGEKKKKVEPLWLVIMGFICMLVAFQIQDSELHLIGLTVGAGLNGLALILTVIRSKKKK